MGRPAQLPRRTIRSQAYIHFFLLFALLLFVSHFPFLSLPYFWDEAVLYVPASFDLYHDGAWIPHSVPPAAHPPGVMAYLAACWRIFGYQPAVARSGMLFLTTFGILASFLLAIELGRDSKGMPAFLAGALLCATPVLFAQSIMAQLDAPAMVFTALALLLFLQDRIRASAVACVALVLMKETGAVVPLVLGGWLAWERRWKDACYFAAPLLALGGWLAVLKRGTGHWLGSPGFTDYNALYLLQPVRLAVSLSRRLYYLFVANFHWVGAIAIVYAWRRSRLFFSRPWKVAWLLVAVHIGIVTVFGGAVLERYLLPVMPVIYTAMAVGLAQFARTPRRIATAVLLGGVAAANFINPPYPFPYENNLAFTDFVRLQMDAADYIEHWYPEAKVLTAWPAGLELSNPKLGFVKQPIQVDFVRNFSTPALAVVDWPNVQVMLTFSRTWDPDYSLMHWGPVNSFWRKHYGALPFGGVQEIRDHIPLPVERHIERRGQWVDIYVNPKTPRSGPIREERLRAADDR